MRKMAIDSERQLAVQYRPVAALIPYARNPRTHFDAQVAEIAASIREFGFTNPILVDGESGIIAGHGRLLAARQLGMKSVPVIELAGLSEAQKRAYIIADNKLALNAGWDTELLALELGDLKDLGFDLALTGFSEEELAGLLSLGTAGLTDPDDVPPLPDEPVSRSGDLWLLGPHRLLLRRQHESGRCRAGARKREAASDGHRPALWRELRSVLAEPGGLNHSDRKSGKVENDDRADWREAWALFPGDVAYVWHAAWFTSTVQSFSGSVRLRDPRADHLGEGPLRPLPRPLPLAARAVLVCRARHGPLEGRPLAIDALDHPLPRGPRPRAWHAEAGRVHAPADAEQLFARPGGL